MRACRSCPARPAGSILPALRACKINEKYNGPTLLRDWGTVTHVGIFGSATGSDMLFFGQLSAPITVKNGDGAVKIDPHALHINFGG